MGLMMFLDIIFLLVSLGLILLAAEFFTNGVEHLGDKLNLGEGAVGSVLAAVGTALPETLIPVAAIFLGSGTASHEIGLGAIVGAPFMLSTLAFAITAIAALVYMHRREKGATLCLDRAILGRDLCYFLPMYALAVATSWLPQGPLRWLACVLLLGGYIHYVIANLRAGGTLGGDIKPLRFHIAWTRVSLTQLPEETRAAFLDRRRSAADESPHLWLSIAQIVAALVVMMIGARFFVDQVADVSRILGVSSLLTALVLAPIATELPEKFNSVIWVRQGKDVLAMGNITGAMVFQSSIPVTLGILFTDWNLAKQEHGHAVLISALIALFSAGLVLAFTRRRSKEETGHTDLNSWVLLMGLPLYIFFIIALKLGL
jgi:cation:H+ antiporter